jgi:hypothetical protein
MSVSTGGADFISGDGLPPKTCVTVGAHYETLSIWYSGVTDENGSITFAATAYDARRLCSRDERATTQWPAESAGEHKALGHLGDAGVRCHTYPYGNVGNGPSGLTYT